MGLRLVAEARPDAVAAVLTNLASDQTEMRTIVVAGSVRAKKRGAVPASKVRSILPMPVVLCIVDTITALRMTTLIDRFAITVLLHSSNARANGDKSWTPASP